MFGTQHTFRAVALLAGLLTGVGTRSAEAAYILLGDSGWRAHFGSGLNVKLDGVTNDRAEVKIEKIAQFTDPFDRGVGSTLEITFEQVSYDAVPIISVDSEFVFNQTGSNWSGFSFSVTEAISGAGTNVRFDEAKTFGDNDPFTIAPFTEYTFNSDRTHLQVSGGLLADGEVWLPGSGNGAGELVIFAAPAGSGSKTAFFFKEQPVIASIPSPGATAMLGLAGASWLLTARRRRQPSV